MHLSQLYSNYLIICCLALVAIGCNSISSQNDVRYKADGLKTSCNTEHILTLQDIIVLESNDNALISSIKEIATADSLLYILDIRNRVFAFNRDGSYKFTIDAKGSGPGEYRRIDDIAWNADTHQLVLLDRDRVLLYSDNGLFICDQTLNGSFLELVSFNDKYILSRYPYPNGKPVNKTICVTDSNFNILEEYITAPDLYMPYARSIGKNLSLQNGKMWYTFLFDHNIYTLDQTTVIDWNGLEFSPKQGIKYDYASLFQSCLESNEVFEIGNIATNDSIMYFSSNLGHHFVNIADRSIESYSHLNDNRFGIPLSVCIPIDGVTGRIVVPIQPDILLQVNKKCSNGSVLSDLCSQLTTESNPVLFIYDLK